MSPSEEYLAQQRAQERAAMVRQVVSHRGQKPSLALRPVVHVAFALVLTGVAVFIAGLFLFGVVIAL